MASELVKELIDAGIHFGHRASRWNPKMKPYIFGKRNLIHIINVKETLKGLLLGKRFLTQTVAKGSDVVLVGTKRQARKAIEEQAARVSMHWVTNRWLGGTLTNFHEIRKRVGRLEQLEQMEADGLLDAYSKKQGASLRREMRKIQRNLGGIRNMKRLPGAMVIIDQKRELIAIKEANKLKIPVLCLLDTECDPDYIDIPIPGNDDAMRAIQLIVKELCDAVAEGLAGRAEVSADQTSAEQSPAEQSPEPKRRRSRRTTTARAEEGESPAEPSKDGEESKQTGKDIPQSETAETEAGNSGGVEKPVEQITPPDSGGKTEQG